MKHDEKATAPSPSVQNRGEGETGKDGVDVPLAPSWLDEAMKLAENYARAWQHDVDGNYVVKEQAAKAKAALHAHLAAGVLVPFEAHQPPAQGDPK